MNAPLVKRKPKPNVDELFRQAIKHCNTPELAELGRNLEEARLIIKEMRKANKEKQ